MHRCSAAVSLASLQSLHAGISTELPALLYASTSAADSPQTWPRLVCISQTTGISPVALCAGPARAGTHHACDHCCLHHCHHCCLHHTHHYGVCNVCWSVSDNFAPAAASVCPHLHTPPHLLLKATQQPRQGCHWFRPGEVKSLVAVRSMSAWQVSGTLQMCVAIAVWVEWYEGMCCHVWSHVNIHRT